MPLNHQQIEKKWQTRWAESSVFQARDNDPRPKFYCLIEFPYPSGAGLHVGHTRSYTALDVLSRKRRLQGYNVLYPIGWDAFGLPTENYAIKTGRPPQEVTQENIATFKRQLQALGFGFDWSREVDTTHPSYYRWTQWMFLEFFRAGLAYKAKAEINWCPECKIGLANEEAVGGVCERCGAAVEKRERDQWMLMITKYADRLLIDLESVDYPTKIKKQQQDWIGRSAGVEVDFPLSDQPFAVRIFTTRLDTIDGATFLVLSPELATKLVKSGWSIAPAARAYATAAVKQRTEVKADAAAKSGVDTGLLARNPFNNELLPVWVADYVLGDYGSGAIMAVPQHDERDRAFATAHALSIVDRPLLSIDETITRVNGKKIIRYKLRDWVFSRQRYWGEPIPLVHCASGCSPQTNNWVAVPDDALPVKLPELASYRPSESGESPLASVTEWVKTTCPVCGGPARRETDTMPNWAGSSWYFLRYVDPHNAEALASPAALKYWLPVDWYNGGMEHTTLHLLYSRFWNKFLFDRGLVPVSEPYAKRTSHGLVLAEDGTKMSKSKGNVVNPDALLSEYGADALRLYILFMGPFAEPVPWSTNGLVGMRRFLDRVERLSSLLSDSEPVGITRALHRTIKKVGDDIEEMRYNTAVSQLMIFVNLVHEARALTRETLLTFLTVFALFAPHLGNELRERLGAAGLIEETRWPVYDAALIRDETVSVAIQVNGKLRAIMTVAVDLPQEQAVKQATAMVKVARYVADQEIKKIIYVPGRLLNIVV